MIGLTYGMPILQFGEESSCCEDQIFSRFRRFLYFVLSDLRSLRVPPKMSVFPYSRRYAYPGLKTTALDQDCVLHPYTATSFISVLCNIGLDILLTVLDLKPLAATLPLISCNGAYTHFFINTSFSPSPKYLNDYIF
jgi:hypothetical protein